MRRFVLLPLLALMACGGESGSDPPGPDEPQTGGCEEPEVTLADGTCLRPGIPEDGCAPGFVHDGGHGCEPVLPSEACPDGRMAVPGDTACRAPMACGEGIWGDLPVDDDTVYVDTNYAGSDADGTAARPWPTIGEAVAAAMPGALIAVAEGTYAENVVIVGKPVRLWGICPDRVQVVASSMPLPPCGPASICIIDQADGTEIGGMALSGGGFGVLASGSTDLLLEGLRVHDTADSGLYIDVTFGATTATVRDTLLERNTNDSVFMQGSTVAFERVQVRDGIPTAAGTFGRGIETGQACVASGGGYTCDPASRGTLSLSASVVERHQEYGIFISGYDVNVVGSVVRDVDLSEATQYFGRGIGAQPSCNVTPQGTVCAEGTRSNVVVQGSLIEGNVGAGMVAATSDVTIDSTVFRRNLPHPTSGIGGIGLNLQRVCYPTPDGETCDTQPGAQGTVTRSLFDHNVHFAVGVVGAAGSFDQVVIRDTQPTPEGHMGVGLIAQPPCNAEGQCEVGFLPAASISNSLLTQNQTLGIFGIVSDLAVQSTVVRDTRMNPNGLYGDGIGVLAHAAVSSLAAITDTAVRRSDRAGIASFGAQIALRGNELACADFELVTQPHSGADPVLEDQGANRCGCPDAEEGCKAISAGLTPPTPPSSF